MRRASETPTWFFSMFWIRAGSSNSVELLLLDGRLLWDKKRLFTTGVTLVFGIQRALQARIREKEMIEACTVHSFLKAWRASKEEKNIRQGKTGEKGRGEGHKPEVFHWTITVKIREVAAVMNEVVLQKESVDELFSSFDHACKITADSLLLVSLRH